MSNNQLAVPLKLGRRPLLMLFAFFLGAIIGYLAGPKVVVIKPLGDIFIYLLKFLIGPLIFVSITLAISFVADMSRLGRVFGRFLIYWLVMGFISAAIGFVMAGVIKPGVGVKLEPPPGWTPPKIAGIDEIIATVIPNNFIAPFLNLQGMQIIVAAILFGIAAVLLGRDMPDKKQLFVDVLNAILGVIYKFIDIVLWYAPIGIFALAANLVGVAGGMVLGAVFKMVLTQWVAYAIILFIIHPILLVGYIGVNPFQYWRKIYPAMITAFSTTSSSATMPVTLERTSKLGVPVDMVQLIIPIAATINMQAVAAEMPIYVAWASQMYGVSLTGGQIAIALFLGVIGAAACAGVPGGGIIVAAMTLSIMGLPLTPVPWIAGIYTLIDMPNTMLNVTGDPLGVMVVAKGLGEFDKSRFYASD
ncbi:MAG: dicarboxylate/amino acid:cation symporter [Synergistetes bacterium]|nr:dicarboxylate/amino acid:cation symporter [Synergistota bacterium]MCX8127337.1 dicarboxylate/amino acid:cation symporter [Synergistota bacterium]MDW8192201.1 dicarboxylate/amino acid:cation symporter [Synergistota bacterium]